MVILKKITQVFCPNNIRTIIYLVKFAISGLITYYNMELKLTLRDNNMAP